jgi:hypothetical protein
VRAPRVHPVPAFLCGLAWGFLILLAAQAATREPAPPGQTCYSPPPADPDRVCPGWLFGSSLEQAKARICRPPR